MTRPMNLAKKKAVENDDTTYITFCKRCNEKTEHYVANSGCKTCRKVNIDYAKVKREQLGLKYYDGSPCKTCGNTLRYTSSRNCVECQKKNRHWYEDKSNQTDKKFHQIKHNYGIDKDEWYWMLKEQNYQCKICKKEMNIEKNSSDICVDHDHKTGKVGGLLCSNCNKGLGNFKDDVVALQSAIIYIKEVREINVN